MSLIKIPETSAGCLLFQAAVNDVQSGRTNRRPRRPTKDVCCSAEQKRGLALANQPRHPANIFRTCWAAATDHVTRLLEPSVPLQHEPKTSTPRFPTSFFLFTSDKLLRLWPPATSARTEEHVTTKYASFSSVCSITYGSADCSSQSVRVKGWPFVYRDKCSGACLNDCRLLKSCF